MKYMSLGLVALTAVLSAAVVYNLGTALRVVMTVKLPLVPYPSESRRTEGERHDSEVLAEEKKKKKQEEEEEEGEEEEEEEGTAQEKLSECPSVLTAAREGSWHQSISQTQRQEMIRFYSQLINRTDVTPFNSQRPDGRCGNVSFPRPHANWRASCDPDGPTPCCYDNVCVSKSVAECACKDCLDMRTMVFAEYATWRPSDKRCPMAAMTKTEICDLLAGHTVVLVGDSLTMHFYLGLLQVVRGHGDAASTGMERCGGKDLFLPKNGCLKGVPFNAKVCGGKARTKFIHFYHPSQGMAPNLMIRTVVSELKSQKAIAVLGIGSHYGVDAARVVQDSLLPLIQKMSLEGITHRNKLVFAGVHAKKNYRAGGQEASFTKKVLRYNTDIEEVLLPWDVPFMDTFNLTHHRVLSLDGNHYGLGVNTAKANILLHYILELQRKGLW